jgi:hypothetical protein
MEFHPVTLSDPMNHVRPRSISERSRTKKRARPWALPSLACTLRRRIFTPTKNLQQLATIPSPDSSSATSHESYPHPSFPSPSPRAPHDPPPYPAAPKYKLSCPASSYKAYFAPCDFTHFDVHSDFAALASFAPHISFVITPDHEPLFAALSWPATESPTANTIANPASIARFTMIESLLILKRERPAPGAPFEVMCH